MELSENRKNSQTVREFALPGDREVSHGDRVAKMLRGFVQATWDKGSVRLFDSTSRTRTQWEGYGSGTFRPPKSTPCPRHPGMGAKARNLQPEVRRGAQGRVFVTEGVTAGVR